MTEPIERELKLALAREAYDALKQLLPHFRIEIVQTNYYFDTYAFNLLQAAATLRIRKSLNRSTITYKAARSIKAGYFEALELESPLPENLSLDAPDFQIETVLPSNLKTIILPLTQDAALRCLGSITTRRRKYELAPGLLGELDLSLYGDNDYDYELELETADVEAACSVVRPLFSQAGIPWQPQQVTKYQRFLARRYPQTLNLFPARE